MEFAAICLRNALLLLPEHQQQDSKTENGSKNFSQSGSTESGSENSDACRSDPSTKPLLPQHINMLIAQRCPVAVTCRNSVPMSDMSAVQTELYRPIQDFFQCYWEDLIHLDSRLDFALKGHLKVMSIPPYLWYGSVQFDMCDVFCSGKGQEADKFLSAAPSSPLRKQEVENLR